MSKQKMLMARALIEQKRFAAARKLLQTIDHPMAAKWLQQLDKIDLKTEAAEQPEPISEARATVPAKQRRSRQSTTKSKPIRPPTAATSRRSGWLLPTITGLLGLAVGVVLGMALAPTEDTGILPLDLTRQAIEDTNSTTAALVAEATARAQAGPSEFELTATAITDLNATTIAIINATGTAASQPTASPTQAPVFPPEDSATEFPVDPSDNSDDSDRELPFDPSSSSPFGGTGSSDDSSSGGPPFDTGDAPETTSEAPFGAESTPTREGG